MSSIQRHFQPVFHETQLREDNLPALQPRCDSVSCWPQGVGNLQKQPGNGGVNNGYLEYIPASWFSVEAQLTARSLFGATMMTQDRGPQTNYWVEIR